MTIKEITERLLKEKKVAIFCHMRPDGDTVGSALALSVALKTKNVSSEVFCSDAIPKRLTYLSGAKEIKRELSSELSGEFSAFVAIDCADISRLGDFAEIFSAQKNTYNIDHHVSNTRYAKYNCVVDSASNCDNVYDMFVIMGVEISEEAAISLETGIMTDTGNFRHKNVTPETLIVSGALVKAGADMNKIAYYNFTMQSKERAKLFGITMSKLRYFKDGKIVFSSVLKEDVKLSGASEDETEGFIDFIMGIEGVEVGACLLQTDKNAYKISLRSRGKTDVNEIASYFGGGGHILASGCRIAGEYEEVVDKLREIIERYMPE